MNETIVVIDEAYTEPGVSLSGQQQLQLLDTQVLALSSLIYGLRQPKGFTPAHDHQEDGGENIGRPILSHSFGQFRAEWTASNQTMRGIPIGIPRTTGDPATQKTFAPVTTNDYTDHSGAKRMFTTVVQIPGGVVSVVVGVLMSNTTAGSNVQLSATFGHLQDINFKLGCCVSEVRGDITVTRSGAAPEGLYYFSTVIGDLTPLGDPTLDREVFFSLWLSSNAGYNLFTDLICAVEVAPYEYSSRMRQMRSDDTPQPQVSLREVLPGKAAFTSVIGDKIKGTWNNLIKATLGAAPGLLPSGEIDGSRRYLEQLDDCHRHQGVAVPDIDGTVFSDGAVLADYQSFGYIQTLGGEDPSSTDPHLSSDPALGRVLHSSASLASGWTQFNFRRSIPAGCGALLMRFGISPYTLTRSATLLVKVSIVPVGGGSEIVTRTQCGQFLSEDDPTHTDYQYCELIPKNDPGFQSYRSLYRGGFKGWNRGSEIASSYQSKLKLNSKLVRISEPLIVKITYPPLAPTETRHNTGDYDVKVRYKLRLAPGGTTYDSGATCQFITCQSMPGF